MQRVDGQHDHLWRLIEDISIGMLVTHDGEGDHLRARPMGARCKADENAIYFLTSVESGKDEEVESNHNVCVAFADSKGQKYVSVTGSASVSNDRARIRELWTTLDGAWFKNADDPAIRLLRVEPSHGEYWDSPGSIVSFVKMSFAAVTGAKVHTGENKKVDLGGR